MVFPKQILVTATAPTAEGPVPEPLPAYPIGAGFAQLSATPFQATQLACGDIVELDDDRAIRRVVVKNARTYHLRLPACLGPKPTAAARRALEKAADYLVTCGLPWTCRTDRPGLIAVSLPVARPLEYLLDLADRAPCKVEVVVLQPRTSGTGGGD